MKLSLCILSNILALNCVFSQCPQPGIKVQSKNCVDPKALSVSEFTCTEMKIRWIGNKDQSYIIKATGDSIIDLKISEASCDNQGNCTGNIKTTPGITVNWSVQAICNIQGLTLYSEPVAGPVTLIAACRDGAGVAGGGREGITVFPNPSTGNITVACNVETNGSVQIIIYDANGKMVFNESRHAIKNMTNQYSFDLHMLAAGAYVVETISGTTKGQATFVIVK